MKENRLLKLWIVWSDGSTATFYSKKTNHVTPEKEEAALRRMQNLLKKYDGKHQAAIIYRWPFDNNSVVEKYINGTKK